MAFEMYAWAVPSLPAPEPAPRSSIFPFMGDEHLPYILPALTYWAIGLTFHYIDTKGYLQRYKLHTPAEFLKKNRATRWDVIKFALLQQLAQLVHGYVTSEPNKVYPSEAYSIAVWARRIRCLDIFVAQTLQFINLSSLLSEKQLNLVAPPGITAPKALFGGSLYLNNSRSSSANAAVGPLPFSDNELLLARLVQSWLYPLFQYALALALADTWQYWTHRVYHANKWLYKHIHALHHDVYVPFAYGAFYNHPLETIPVDVIGFPICLGLAGLDDRQATLFSCLWTWKTVVDHCGYDLPWNPSNLICPSSVLFHDLHHQTWGLKNNFSNYSSFWDLVLGTYLNGRSLAAQQKYAKGRKTAEGPASDAEVIHPLGTSANASSTAIER